MFVYHYVAHAEIRNVRNSMDGRASLSVIEGVRRIHMTILEEYTFVLKTLDSLRTLCTTSTMDFVGGRIFRRLLTYFLHSSDTAYFFIFSRACVFFDVHIFLSEPKFHYTAGVE